MHIQTPTRILYFICLLVSINPKELFRSRLTILSCSIRVPVYEMLLFFLLRMTKATITATHGITSTIEVLTLMHERMNYNVFDFFLREYHNGGVKLRFLKKLREEYVK